MKRMLICTGVAALLLAGCCPCKCGTSEKCSSGEKNVKLITIDPGHFHAALIQSRMYPQVSSKVHVYAPQGEDLNMHMARIESFNKRADEPTSWESALYVGDDFLERAIEEKAGNVVVLAGNNARKTEYILKCVSAGLHVLADKPMAITPKDFEMLQQAFEIAKQNKVMLYDIMTERYEITSILQSELSRFPELFGEQEKGTVEDPAVVKESVHHFSKLVAGAQLRRPPWYYDTRQQGEAIVDVNTHLVDLVQCALFPEAALKFGDVQMRQARSWPTPITLEEFTKSTAAKEWPDYLKRDLDANQVLQCKANGEFVYSLGGVNCKLSVRWNYEAPEGSGDTHFSLMRGTRSSLIIEQGPAENFKPVLYVEPRRNVKKEEVASALQAAIAKINQEWPGIKAEPHETGFRVLIPKEYEVGHEAHFSQVAQKYFGFLEKGSMPAWEVPNMLVKYHTLMEAYTKSR